MKKIFKSGIAFLLAVVFTVSLIPIVGLANEQEVNTEVVEKELKHTLQSPNKEPASEIEITGNTDEQTYTYKFPYSDDFFKGKPDVFNSKLCSSTFGLLLSAGNSQTDKCKFLDAAAFDDTLAINYDVKDRNNAAFVIGHRKIDDQIVIAVGIRGQGYTKEEWAGNFMVGGKTEHEGFRLAANNVKEEIENYIETYVDDTESDKVLWITGFSRAAAITNIVAADYSSALSIFDKVFAYDFATPTTVKRTLFYNPESYKNIFNILNKDDVMPGVPLESWGFMRNGVDMYIPAMETDPTYGALKVINEQLISEMSGGGLKSKSNADWNFHIHMIRESLAVLFPTNQFYKTYFQDALCDIVEKRSIGSIINAILDALVMMRKESWIQKKELLRAINYIAFVLKEDHVQDIKEGIWDDKAPAEESYFYEHQPYVYLSWMLLYGDDGIVSYPEQSSRKFGLKGNIDATIYSDGKPLVTVKRDGTIINHTKNPNVLGRRKGQQTLFILPRALDATVEITSYKAQEIEYLDIKTEHDRTFNTNNKIMYSNVKKDVTYTIPLEPYKPAGKISRLDGKKMGLFDTIYFSVIYKPSLVMDFEYCGEEVLYKDFDSIKDVKQTVGGSEDDFYTDLQNYINSQKPERDVESFIEEDAHISQFIEQLIDRNERIVEIEGTEYEVVEVFAQKDNPKTGDDNWIWYVILFLSLIATLGLASIYIKKQH